MVLGAACAGKVRQTAPVLARPATGAAAHYVEADVRFMQGMITHHAQAVEMTKLVAARIRRWLEARGQPVSSAPQHEHTGEHRVMPGMLSSQEQAQLANARGLDFD